MIDRTESEISVNRVSYSSLGISGAVPRLYGSDQDSRIEVKDDRFVVI